MTREQKLQELAAIFEEDVSSLTPETEIKTLVFDSVVKMSLIVFLSDKFERKIGVNELNAVNTIQDILNFCESS